MQTPTMKTPVSKCLDLAAYSARMLGKFPGNANLAALAQKMGDAAAALDATQGAYAAAVRAILPARVDVKYENHVSDRRVRLAQQKAEMADGRKGGPIASQAFPDGSSPITRQLGASQVKSMQDLEGRLAALAGSWPEATGEKDAIAQHRAAYAAALDARASAGQAARDKRAARDAEKQRFVTIYTEIAARVEAEFPRDKPMQDLFFDDVRTASSSAAADEDEAKPEGEGEPG